MLNFELTNTLVKFKPVTRPLMNFREEIFETAKLIYENADKPLTVGYSGGKDSEVICYVLKELDIPFRPLILKLEHKKDSKEYIHIEKFCEKRGLDPIILDFDLGEFITTGIEKYISEGYYANNIFRYLQIYLLETSHNMGYSCILGSPDYRFVSDYREYKSPGYVSLKVDLDIVTPLKYLEKTNQKHFPYFYFTTPEIFASYLNEDLIKFVLDAGVFHNGLETGFMPEKELIYRKYFPTLVNRLKSSGFEEYDTLRAEKQAELAMRYPQMDKHFYTNVGFIKRQLGI